jgi:hypothetical protein
MSSWIDFISTDFDRHTIRTLTTRPQVVSPGGTTKYSLLLQAVGGILAVMQLLTIVLSCCLVANYSQVYLM